LEKGEGRSKVLFSNKQPPSWPARPKPAKTSKSRAKSAKIAENSLKNVQKMHVLAVAFGKNELAFEAKLEAKPLRRYRAFLNKARGSNGRM
jgi:hypothetical protein